MKHKPRATNFSIVTEGYADKFLIRTLTKHLGIGSVTRKQGKTEVVKHLQATSEKETAFGVIDKDTTPEPYLKNCKKIYSTDHLEFYRHREKPHFMLVLARDVEDWIVAASGELAINLRDYSLPETAKALRDTKRAKTRLAEESETLTALFSQLRKSGIGMEDSLVSKLICVIETVQRSKFC